MPRIVPPRPRPRIRRLGILLLSLGLCHCGRDTFLHRYLFWGPSSIQDVKKFPSKPIKASGTPFRFIKDSAAAASFSARIESVSYTYKGDSLRSPLPALLEASGTTAFIAIRDDTVLAELYLNGHGRDSLQRTFSISKSMTSALLGLAIGDGKVGGAGDSARAYLDWDGLGGITLRHLLTMGAGFKYSDAPLPWTDNVRLYYVPDLRSECRKFVRRDPPGTRFRYNNYSPLLIGLVVEKAAGSALSQYFQERIWERIGTERDASWSVNSETDGLESLGSGFNATAIDLAKFGRLYLRGGDWDGTAVLPPGWVAESTSPDTVAPPGYYPADFQEPGISYRYFWWCQRVEGDAFAFYASGHLGQVLYVYPRKRLILVRCGMRRGDLDRGWHMVFRDIARRL